MYNSNVASVPARPTNMKKYSEYATQFQPWSNLMKSTPNLVDELKHDKAERAAIEKLRSHTAEGTVQTLDIVCSCVGLCLCCNT